MLNPFRRKTPDISRKGTCIKIFPESGNACEITFHNTMDAKEINEWLKRHFKTLPYWEESERTQ